GGVVIAGFGTNGTVPAGKNTIGGTAAGAGNTIANERIAVQVIGSSGNAVLGNAMTNDGVGILLDSDFHANDAGDADGGANGLQNQPVLTAARPAITGTLTSTPNTKFRVEFFRSATSGADYWGN